MPLPAASIPPEGGPPEDYPVDQTSCQLLGPTALVVQGMMGIVVIASLLFKRQREKPKRPWRIWLFDVSKQIVGQMFVHGVNVFISDVGSHRSAGNACVFYFLNILLDTTIGVALIYLVLHVATWALAEKLMLKGFESGQYGTPPSFKFWIRQAAVYVFSLTSMKLLVVALFALWPGIFKLGEWLLSWLGNDDVLQVIFTMGFFPILMNVLQFWLIDSIVKASTPTSTPAVLLNDSPRSSLAEPLFRPSSDDNAGSDDSDFDDGRRDIEAQRRTRPRSRSHSADVKINRRPSNDGERKSRPGSASGSGSGSGPGSVSGSPTPRATDSIAALHAYPPPPSAPSSPTSIHSFFTGPARRSSLSPVPAFSHGHGHGHGHTASVPRTLLGPGVSRKRRSPPPPLLPRSPLPPALNSPDVVAMSERGAAGKGRAGKARGAQGLGLGRAQAGREWEWDEDWAGRVGEEEWTGRRMEGKRGEVAEVWGS